MNSETAEKKPRKPKAEMPYVVGVWSADNRFVPCDLQPARAITQFDDMVKWTIDNFGAHPDKYNFIRRDPRTLTIEEKKVTKGVVG